MPSVEGLRAGPVCPCCGSDGARAIGPIAPAIVFAGRMLDAPIPGGTLWACGVCALRYRYPRPAKAQLDALYASGLEANWNAAPQDRPDWLLVRNHLAERPDIGSVLDVGCFDGRLLEFLGPKYRKLGIEIHPAAAAEATGRGVTVIGSDFGQLHRCSPAADAAIALDVIEHSENPLDFLEGMRNAVRPGGMLLVGSGNSLAPSWRLMGSRYWYCSIAEHISFTSLPWYAFAGRKLGLEIEHAARYSHAAPRTSLSRRLAETGKNLICALSPKVSAFLRRRGAGSDTLRRWPELLLTPPVWITAKDHLLVRMRRRC